MFDIDEVRKQFPMLKQKVHGRPLIYFDSAATALKPDSVIDTMTQFYKEHYGTVHRAIYYFAKEASALYEASRRKIEAFLNAERPEEVVFTKGTTDAINLVARSLGDGFFQEGDEILIPESEHHSNIVPWQMLKARKKVVLHPLPIDDHGVIRIDELVKKITPKTKLISLAHISNFTGALQPIEKIIKIAKENNVLVFLDAAQSIPHLPIDVQSLKVDFLAFSGHKAFGPTGIGVLYAKKEHLEKMPPVQGGGDMIEKVTWETTTYQHPPLKFEAGTPMIAEVIGLGAAIDFIESLGRQEIASYEQKLLDYATLKLREIPELKILGEAKEKGAIISFIVDGCHPLDLGTLLDLEGIALRTGHLCTQPAMQRFQIREAMRVSFAPYNSIQEIDCFVTALKQSIHSLK
jgi:cysteine desulfurase/selenocysteine lyase